MRWMDTRATATLGYELPGRHCNPECEDDSLRCIMSTRKEVDECRGKGEVSVSIWVNAPLLSNNS